ncbi:unnamed protein product, partial [marine sediment metagenome]
EFLTAYRLKLTDHIYIGPGIGFLGNLSDQRDVDFGTEGEAGLKPCPSQFFYPLLSLAYLTTYFELDLYVFPWTSGSGMLYVLESLSDYAVDDTVGGLYGISGGGAVTLYFNLRTGLRLSANYFHLWNTDTTLADEGYSAVDKLDFLMVKLGLVFRF